MEHPNRQKIAIRQRLADLLEQRRGALVKIGQLLAGTEEDPLLSHRSDLKPIAWEDIEPLIDDAFGQNAFHLFMSSLVKFRPLHLGKCIMFGKVKITGIGW